MSRRCVFSVEAEPQMHEKSALMQDWNSRTNATGMALMSLLSGVQGVGFVLGGLYVHVCALVPSIYRYWMWN